MLDARVDLFFDENFFFRFSFLVPFFFMVEHDLCFAISFSLDSFSWVLWSSSSASFHFHLSTNMKVWGGVRLHRPKYLSRLTLLWILSNGMHILGPNTLGQGTILSGKVRTQQHRVPTSSNMTP